MEEERSMEEEVIVLKDEAGRELNCYVKYVDVEDEEYMVLIPVDYPVNIFTWVDADDEEPQLVEDDAEIDQLFDLAKAVLGEQNLKLKRTAVTLTVEGELPDLEELDESDNAEEDYEEFQMLASFLCNEQEYEIYTPLDPIFILARMTATGEPVLLSQEELERISPYVEEIENQLLEEFE